MPVSWVVVPTFNSSREPLVGNAAPVVLTFDCCPQRVILLVSVLHL